jgi:hypothetical protein
MDPRVPDAAEALETLVNQFADPLSFFRELVQNSVDAGSNQVDIAFEYQEPEDGRGDGVMIIHVDDYGEGMDRRIIDTKLTRLFSSSKEGDYTKIGRFGIGFVSVFSLRPEAVCVDTSRGGENWRVLFREDRTFVRIARDTPVEGTKIRICKALPRAEYQGLRSRSADVVRFWCRYLKAEIRFEGERINEPFELDAEIQVRHSEEGTEVVAGYPRDGEAFSGFYNRGLTLLEEPDGPFEGVAFRIDSRYLEHTLTRDNVIRDSGFEKAMAIVRRLVEGPLFEALLERIETGLANGVPDADLEPYYAIVNRQVRGVGRIPTASIDRTVFRSVTGRNVSGRAVRQAAQAKTLYLDLPGNLVGESLEKAGNLVVAIPGGPGARDALFAVAGTLVFPASTLFCLPSVLSRDVETTGQTALREAVDRILRNQGRRVARIDYARFDYPGSSIRDRVAISRKGAEGPASVYEARTLGDTFLARRRHLLLNADHPTVVRLAGLATWEPELAAYMLAKLFFLRREMTSLLDSELASLALEARCRRLTV